MRLHHATTLLLLCGGLTGTAARAADPREGKPADAEIRQLLVGTWATGQNNDPALDAKGTIRYDKAGTFVAAGTVKLAGEPLDVRVEGTWTVADGSVTLAVTKTSHKGIAPVGAEMKETVVQLTDKTLRVRRGHGKVRERTRVTE